MADGCGEFFDRAVTLFGDGTRGAADDLLPIARRTVIERGVGDASERMDGGERRNRAALELFRRTVTGRADGDGFAGDN